jgi:hypothetical protein
MRGYTDACFPVALEILMQLALQDIGQLTDLNRVRGGAVCQSAVDLALLSCCP